MASLICIKMVCGTFCRLFNIANRFLWYFSNLETSIRNWFPGGCTIPPSSCPTIDLLLKIRIQHRLEGEMGTSQRIFDVVMWWCEISPSRRTQRCCMYFLVRITKLQNQIEQRSVSKRRRDWLISPYYRQDRKAEYKTPPPGRAMSPALGHHVTHCTQVSPSLCSKCICVSWWAKLVILTTLSLEFHTDFYMQFCILDCSLYMLILKSKCFTIIFLYSKLYIMWHSQLLNFTKLSHVIL